MTAQEKAKLKRAGRRTITIEEGELVCANCKHFYQHYTCSRYAGIEYYARCNAGHCSYPRIKDRKPGQEGCVYFEFV